MLPSMMIRNHPPRKLSLGVQVVLIILVKVLVLTVIWYAVVRGHKKDGSTDGTATYFLNPDATPQPKTKPGSIWR